MLPRGRSLALASYREVAIPNRTDVGIGPGDVALAERGLRPLLAVVQRRTPPTDRYNCHGLVFAARRTNIPPPGDESRGLIDRILREDDYRRIPERETHEGDLVVWRSTQDIDHTGFVIAVSQAPRTPIIWSMWGGLGEFVHSVHATPYTDCSIEYWRPAYAVGRV